MATDSPINFNRRGDSIRVHVQARNPATRIQVVDPSGHPMLRSAATGSLRIGLHPHEVYKILYWIGSGRRQERLWQYTKSPEAQIDLPDVPFISAIPVPLSGPEEDAWRQFNAGARGPAYDEPLIAVRFRYQGDRSPLRDRATPAALDGFWVAWVDDANITARPPHRISVAESADALLYFDVAEKQSGSPALLIGAPIATGSDTWIYRPLPRIAQRLPRVYLLANLDVRTEAPIDWRFARYGLHLSLDAEPFRPEEDSRFEEALMERLRSPGTVSSSIVQFLGNRRAGNVVAQMGGWLLCARSSTQDFKPQTKLLGAFDRWMKDKNLLEFPDAWQLQYFLEAKKYQSLDLTVPIFSETWRLLSRIPAGGWLQSKAELDSLAWRVANAAQAGGVWLSWTPNSVSSLKASDRAVSGLVERGPTATIRLVQQLQEILRESDQNVEVFATRTSWTDRTLLERQILTRILAHGTEVPEDEGAASDLLEEFARDLQLPLPIVALSVDRMAKQELTSATPPPVPGSPPTRTAIAQHVPAVQRVLIAGSVTGASVGALTQTTLGISATQGDIEEVAQPAALRYLER